MTTRYLSLAGFAERAGIAANTARAYREQGRLPEPDATIGAGSRATLGWLPETVDYWMNHRVGQGKRTDLATNTASRVTGE